MIDPVLQKYEANMKSWGYLTENIRSIREGGAKSELSDLARLT